MRPCSLIAVFMFLATLIGGMFAHPAQVAAEPMYPNEYYNLVRNEALPNMLFKPNGPNCGCGGLGVLQMPEGYVEASPQGKVLMNKYGGTAAIAFGEWTAFRVSSPDAALSMKLDGRPFAATNYLSKGGMILTLDIKQGDNISRLKIQVESAFPHINPFTEEAPGKYYVPETKHNIEPVFMTQWLERGGLAQIGYPVTPSGYEKIGNAIYVVQYFERHRFEYHPESTNPVYIVQLGQFGRIIHGGADAPVPPMKDHTIRYFPETGHHLSGRFKAYWEANGGLSQFGYPITEEFQQVLEDGMPHTVQYFERARFEFHVAAPEPYKVLLGRFGLQIASKLASDRFQASK